MRSFLLHTCALLTAAVSIIAAPLGNFEARFASRADLDAVFAREIGKITFGNHVPAEEHAGITSAIHAHHNSLAADDPAKAAKSAHVSAGWHTTQEDPNNHATVRFHSGASPKGANHIDTHHVYPRADLDAVFAREIGKITFGNHVPAEEREGISSAIHAHHNSLAANDPAKAAKSAHVSAGWHTTDEDHNSHATVRFHSGASPKGANHIDTHHVYPRADLDAVFAREIGKITFGNHVPAEEREGISSAIHAHHNSLAANDPAKAAKSAHVSAGWHTTDEDHNNHATVRFHSGASPKGANHIDTHHVYPTA